MSPLTGDPTAPDEFSVDPESTKTSQDELLRALVVVWCPNEAWRIGEAAILPAQGSGKRLLLGRGSGELGDPCPKLCFARYAEGRIESALPLGTPGLSRRQALLACADDGTIEFENVGKARLFHNGVQSDRASAAPGDVIQFGKQLLLLCVNRPRSIASVPEGYPAHEYGRADAFGIVGESPAIGRLRRTIGFIAKRSEHVLIYGASGTGKELIARAVHALSPRNANLLVSRNAATIPEALFDAELFGNVKNYPQAGMPARPGLVGQAHGSTIFLDEFAEMPPALQAHLLRLMDAGEYQRLGESALSKVDVRVIGATNRALSAIKDDLLARFTLRVDVADLNSRREDIPWLVRHALSGFAASDPGLRRQLFANGDSAGEPRLEIDFMCRLLRHRYTTNMRELQMLLWASIEGADGSALTWPANAVQGGSALSRRPGDPAPESDQPERERLQAILDRHNGRIEPAWRELGLRNRYALRRLIGKYKLELRRRPS